MNPFVHQEETQNLSIFMVEKYKVLVLYSMKIKKRANFLAAGFSSLFSYQHLSYLSFFVFRAFVDAARRIKGASCGLQVVEL